jgi:hypothetical protein
MLMSQNTRPSIGRILNHHYDVNVENSFHFIWTWYNMNGSVGDPGTECWILYKAMTVFFSSKWEQNAPASREGQQSQPWTKISVNDQGFSSESRITHGWFVGLLSARIINTDKWSRGTVEKTLPVPPTLIILSNCASLLPSSHLYHLIYSHLPPDLICLHVLYIEARHTNISTTKDQGFSSECSINKVYHHLFLFISLVVGNHTIWTAHRSKK